MPESTFVQAIKANEAMGSAGFVVSGYGAGLAQIGKHYPFHECQQCRRPPIPGSLLLNHQLCEACATDNGRRELLGPDRSYNQVVEKELRRESTPKANLHVTIPYYESVEVRMDEAIEELGVVVEARIP